MAETKLQKTFKTLKMLARILLSAAIIALACSCVLILIFEFNNQIAFGFMWYSIMDSVLVAYFAVLVLASVAIYHKVKKEKIWPSIKKEMLLLAITIVLLLVLGLINNYFADY